MEIITSKNNAVITLANKLKDKKYRLKQNKVLLEGKKIILEALNCGYNIDYVLSCDINDKSLFNAKFLLIDEKLCKYLSFTVTSQNIFAIVSLKENQSQKLSNKVLVLDKVQNPDNLGAIIRCAVATGFTDIFSIDSVDLFNDKCIRASMGNVFKINLHKVTYDDITFLKQSHTIVVADMFGENIFKTSLNSKNIALVVGNEGNGISREVNSLKDKTISIPMQNNVESLNVSVSAGILMYQINNLIGE